jgi:hypothetical protein
MNTLASPVAPAAAPAANDADDPLALVVRRHLRVGWLSLLVFLTLGLALEALHGLKVQAYLNAMNETRRLMWTLAHAHGTLLAVVNLGFAFTVNHVPAWRPRTRTLASCAFIAGSVLMPGGFFLGGVWVYAGDPGLGILLVPVGGLLLFLAVLLTALSLKHFEVQAGKTRMGTARAAKR